MNTRAIAWSLLVLAGGAPPARSRTRPRRQPPATPAADARLQGAYRFERNGWIYVHLQGPPATLGYQHGYLLAAEIADLLRVLQAVH